MQQRGNSAAAVELGSAKVARSTANEPFVSEKRSSKCNQCFHAIQTE